MSMSMTELEGALRALRLSGMIATLQARALDNFIKRERLFVVHDNVFFNQHDQVICSGRGWTIRPV